MKKPLAIITMLIMLNIAIFAQTIVVLGNILAAVLMDAVALR